MSEDEQFLSSSRGLDFGHRMLSSDLCRPPVFVIAWIAAAPGFGNAARPDNRAVAVVAIICSCAMFVRYMCEDAED